MVNNDHVFRLELIKRTDDEIYDFVKTSLELVKEYEKKSIEDEVEQIKSQFHIDHCWITRGNEKVGVVKIIRSTFYSLGLVKNLEADDIQNIFEIIEMDLASWSTKRIEGTIHSDYLAYVQKLGYKIEFSREKLRLKLDFANNLSDFSSLKIKKFAKSYLRSVITMLIEAYKGSIDERIGMFGSDVAHSAIRSILDGRFGEFRYDLSSVVVDERGKVIASVLTTISEGHPFIVIIGVTRSLQRKGSGRKLISWLIDIVKKNNYSEIRLWVTVENTVAYNLYKSIGFESQIRIYAIYK